jgi:vitamin B12/bleomycin/antimicrobial peptide transport system ATP-binding/permease protein
MKKILSRIFRRSAEKPPEAPRPPKRPPPGVTIHEEPGSTSVIFSGVALKGADGEPLIDYGSFTLNPGDRMMISGPAGCGKSAGLAAIRNAWMLGGSGEIIVPPEIRFVPQEDYFPDRSLRGIVCAPDPVSKYTREQVAEALTEAGLEDFIGEMDNTEKRGEYWKNTLSGGQKNKLGFAGAFLHAPEVKVLVLDEITAALDAKSEAALYPKLLERMKHGIVITVAHHASIGPYHNVFATVAEGKVTYAKAPVVTPAAPGPQPQPPKPAI